MRGGWLLAPLPNRLCSLLPAACSCSGCHCECGAVSIEASPTCQQQARPAAVLPQLLRQLAVGVLEAVALVDDDAAPRAGVFAACPHLRAHEDMPGLGHTSEHACMHLSPSDNTNSVAAGGALWESGAPLTAARQARPVGLGHQEVVRRQQHVELGAPQDLGSGGALGGLTWGQEACAPSAGARLDAISMAGIPVHLASLPPLTAPGLCRWPHAPQRCPCRTQP